MPFTGQRLSRYVGGYLYLLDKARLYRKQSGGKLSGKWPKELSSHIFHYFYENGTALIEAFTYEWDVKLIFQSPLIEITPPSLIGKKALLYSGTSICILPCVLQSKTKMTNLDFFIEFISQLSPLIILGKIVPIPLFSQSLLSDRDYSSRFRHIHNKLSQQRVESFALKNKAIPIFGNTEEIRKQISEDIPHGGYSSAGCKGLLLPVLNGVKTDDMINILEDNDNPTQRFRKATWEILNEGKHSDSDRVFLDLIERVDHEVRLLHEKFQIILKDKKIRKLEAALGTLSLGISLFAPESISEIVAAVFGSTTLINGAKNIIVPSKSEIQIKQNDFYLPWLVAQKHPTTQ